MSTTEDTRLSYLGGLFDLRGLGAIVTGGAGGIGSAMAAALARAGAAVTLLDLSSEALEAAQQRLQDEGVTVGIKQADITKADELDAAFAEIASANGLHIVFANAGISAGPGPRLESGRIANVDQDRWNSVLDVNLTGALNTVASASRHIADGYGRIVVTASLAGVRSDAMVGYAYAATKAGVIGIVRNAALELAPRGILVNAIAPGLFHTSIRSSDPVHSRSTDDFVRASAIGRGAQPSEIEGLAVYLASPASSYVTGATISIDGGAQHAGANPVAI
ncbi:SDR family NAD(P)-dependent oxidoreductase [Microbacterium sp. A204]|uniref:SDR family NAD(P)-dependent oxidoreductase n=1 Tax=Microbacterium sp. A204 TaxID=3457321 RepID=UPI003FD122B4